MQLQFMRQTTTFALSIGVATMIAVACGESAPAAAAPAAATPAAATPAAATPAAATPAAATPADFDLGRYQSEISDNLPNGMRVQTEISVPDIDGAMTFEIAARPNDNAFHMKMGLDSDGVALELELITIGDTGYIRGSSAGNTVDWMTAPMDQGEDSPFIGFTGEDFSADAVSNLGEVTAIDVQPCSDGRQCFVLEDAADPNTRILIDTATYHPVVIQNTAPAEGDPTEIFFTDWNADISIDVPSDAREVSTDEFGMAFFGLMMAVAIGAS